MGITIKQTTVELLPEGVYTATIAAVDSTEGQFGPQLKFTFELEELDGKILTGWASQKFNVKSKLYGWVRAALGGREIAPGWDLNTDALIGRQVLLVVVKTKGGDGSEFNKIKDVLAVKPARARGGGGVSPTVNGETVKHPETPSGALPDEIEF